MGCCVSRSTAAAAVERRQVVAVDATAAMVMDLDGTMARLEAPVAARVALGGDAYSCFVCGADELDYGAPARAMGDDEALQPGRSTSCSPSPRSAGRCPATTWPRSPSRPGAALSSIGVPTSSATRRKDDRDGAAASGKRRRTSRVAPLAVVSGIDAHATPLMAKTRKCGRRRACVRRLSVASE
ncbi:hypothetical protein OsJ_29862 [Oryza sativa Japonica Group]|uniref:Uncharacterized protein n=1 Tax=Oryza sativa subsp. japonica TaxID=39947 RepID=B9G4C2_ORYSJ|nr:hypothetical protein OsJ_29862 [Oryza sativa Japonica Group]